MDDALDRMTSRFDEIEAAMARVFEVLKCPEPGSDWKAAARELYRLGYSHGWEAVCALGKDAA